ncbi:MAG: MBL fold metallo-hydrolase [Gallionella sp.]|nr:MBL fold metallo-hydrolase [Gallionella sp.]
MIQKRRLQFFGGTTTVRRIIMKVSCGLRQPFRTLAHLMATAACASALAQPAEIPATKEGTRAFTLGTQGGPNPSRKRAQPANAVVVGGNIYLVDAGNGVVQQMVKAGLDYRRVHQIFITHNHDDHNADWGTLMGLQWSTGRRMAVHVFGPNGTESMLKGFLQYFEPNARIRRADARVPDAPQDLFRAHDIRDGGLVYQDEHVKVTAMEVCHFHFDKVSPPEGGPHKSFAYRFQTADRVVVFSGDTGKCASLVDFARDADLLIHEVVVLPLIEDSLRKYFSSQPGKAPPPGLVADLMRHMAEDHTTPEDIGKLATAARVKKVVLSHFVPGRDSDPDEAYVDGVKKYYTGPIVAARDLMEF